MQETTRSICESTFGLSHFRAHEVFEVEAKVHVEQGRYAEAVRALDQALDVLDAAHEAGHSDHTTKLDALERKHKNVEKRLRRRSTLARDGDGEDRRQLRPGR